MNLSNEQIKKILDEAPEGSTDWCVNIGGKVKDEYGYNGYDSPIGKMDRGRFVGRKWNQIPLSNLRKQLDDEWDGKGLPPVGCKIRTEEGVSEVLSVSDFDGGVVTYSYDDGMSIGCAWNNRSWINPIETEAEKAERERLESAYELYCIMCAIEGYAKFDLTDFSKTKKDSAVWLAIVDKTNYRKEVE